MSAVAVVCPLRPGAAETARVLVAEGPPFDLAGAGIVRHVVFVGEQEAVFVFEGAEARGAVERLATNPGVWRAAAAWRDLLAGRPRLLDASFAWPGGP
ncbi:MAG: hypothetical protein R3C15_23460 [Thermoleophilia bacterium]